jgi:hypothetical protein
LNELINILTKNIFLALAAELEKQNHKLTGALEQSFEAQIKETADKTIINFLMLNYGLALNDGVPPSRIPYTPGPPFRGGKSKYIQGLIRWAKLKFSISEKKATSAAFAIARKHKKHGAPLTARGFINNTLAAEDQQIEKFVRDWTEEIFNDFFKSFLQDTKL